MPDRRPINVVSGGLHAANHYFDEEVGCVGDILRLVAMFDEVLEDRLARIANRAKVISASTGTQRKNTVELGMR